MALLATTFCLLLQLTAADVVEHQLTGAVSKHCYSGGECTRGDLKLIWDRAWADGYSHGRKTGPEGAPSYPGNAKGIEKVKDDTGNKLGRPTKEKERIDDTVDKLGRPHAKCKYPCIQSRMFHHDGVSGITHHKHMLAASLLGAVN